MEQKAIIVTTGAGTTKGLDELNLALRRGWRVAHCTPMGGASVGSADMPTLELAALVIIERNRTEAAMPVEKAEEEVDELIDEIVEGDGANPELADEIEAPELPDDPPSPSAR